MGMRCLHWTCIFFIGTNCTTLLSIQSEICALSNGNHGVVISPSLQFMFCCKHVLLLVTSTNLRFKYSVSNWRKCDTGNDEFLMLRAIPIQKCIFECLVRGRCKAVKFLTIRRECGLLETDINMAIDYNTRPCVFIQMANVQHNLTIPDICNTCSPKQVCNMWNQTCTFEECERLTVKHAVLGNMQSVESKVKIVPHLCYYLSQYIGPTRCNSSGEWENAPTGHGDSETTCPDGWTSFEDHCYLFVHELLTFEEAKANCDGQGSYLLEITNAIENEFIKCSLRDFKPHTTWWLGITDVEEENVWIYNTKPTNVTFTDWYESEPNGEVNEHCGVLWSDYDFQWGDWRCGEALHSLCKKELI